MATTATGAPAPTAIPPKKKKKGPPPLILPKARKVKKAPGSSGLPADPKPLLPVKKVSDLGIGALVVNILLALVVILVVGVVTRFITDEPMFYVTVPLLVTWGLFVFLKDQLWTSVDVQMAEVWMDNIFTDCITVYTQGLHFTPCWYSKQTTELNFQKHEPVGRTADEKIVIKTQTTDGKTVVFEVTEFFQNRDTNDALSHRLRYKEPELKALIRATIESHITDLCGLNSYETLDANKSAIASWLAGIFGGESAISKFEEETGIRLLNPILNNIFLEGTSNELNLLKARFQMAADGKKKLGNDVEALRATQAILGVLKRSENNTTNTLKFENAPPGLHTAVVGGGANLAVGGKDK